MKPSSQINLCNVPHLDIDYDNTYSFNTKEKQMEYFNKYTVFRFLDYSYLRKENSIKVNVNVDDIDYANYLFYKNEKGKTYFCFILDKVYINEKTTGLIIKTDIMQTYQFDYVLLESFVDRCHVDRWTNTGDPTSEFESEGVEVGDLIEESKETIFEYKDNFLIVSSTPLGIVNQNSGGGDGGDGGDGGGTGGNKGKWQSSNGILFIKTFEGFCSGQYTDPVGVLTSGYGFTGSELDTSITESSASDKLARISATDYLKPILLRMKKDGIDINKISTGMGDALVSFVYNLGVGGSTASTWYRLMRDNGDFGTSQAFWDSWLAHNKGMVGGVLQELPGLTRRRNAEMQMWKNNVYPTTYSINLLAKGSGSITGTLKDNGGKGKIPNVYEITV